jgi:metal-responsive CopG/Arc/MetJ family transcriptional regulator
MKKTSFELLTEDQEQEFDVLMEEMHYHNTMNAFVELIVVYGYDKVIGDLRSAMGEVKW